MYRGQQDKRWAIAERTDPLCFNLLTYLVLACAPL